MVFTKTSNSWLYPGPTKFRMSRIGLFELYWPVKRDVRLSCLVYLILKTMRPWDPSVEPKGALGQALKMDCAILAGLMQIRDLREGRPTKEGLVQVHSNGYPKKYPGKFNSFKCWCVCWWIIYVSMYLSIWRMVSWQAGDTWSPRA